MNLRIGNEVVEAEVSEEERFVSPHTGKELRRLYAQFNIEGDDVQDRIQQVFKTTDPDPVVDEGAQGTETRWRVVDHSYGYLEGREPTLYQHDVKLEEFEELVASRLMIQDVTVEPYEYKEEFPDDTLLILAKTQVDRGIAEQLEQLILRRDYYPVIREGVTDETREMRFGQVLWSEHGERRKYDITLVDRRYDDQPKNHPPLMEPQQSNVEKHLARSEALLEHLLGLLERRGVLTGDEIQELRGRAKEDTSRYRRQFSKVEDVDSW